MLGGAPGGRAAEGSAPRLGALALARGARARPRGAADPRWTPRPGGGGADLGHGVSAVPGANRSGALARSRVRRRPPAQPLRCAPPAAKRPGPAIALRRNDSSETSVPGAGPRPGHAHHKGGHHASSGSIRSKPRPLRPSGLATPRSTRESRGPAHTQCHAPTDSERPWPRPAWLSGRSRTRPQPAQSPRRHAPVAEATPLPALGEDKAPPPAGPPQRAWPRPRPAGHRFESPVRAAGRVGLGSLAEPQISVLGEIYM